MTSQSLPAIKVSGVSLTFRERLILDDITITIPQGEFLGIIGPNGGGKTVFLKLLVGLLNPTRGSISIFGKTVSQARGIIGYVPQYAKFDSDFPTTVFRTVLMSRLPCRKSFWHYSDEDRDIALTALRQVEMAELADRPIGRLSGGQLQRVLIARALALQPKLLLLDEPTASLDTKVGQGVYSLLGSIAQQMTIVLVSHDIGVISRHVTSIACLNRHMHYHHSKEITPSMIEDTYGCPVDLLAHGHAHRVLDHHHDTEEE